MGPGKRNGSSTSKAEPKKGGLWSELERYLVYGLVALDLGFSKGVAGMDIRAITSRGCSDWLVLMSHWLESHYMLGPKPITRKREKSHRIGLLQ